MTLPFTRSFNSGRQSELLYNEDLAETYEATRHIAEVPDKGKQPEGKMTGSLWWDRTNNELNVYHKNTDEWVNIFSNKFQIVDQITNVLPSADPVKGQLWIYNDVLCYYDGSNWKPIKALEQDSSQFNLALFEDFLLASPLWTQGNTIVKDEDIEEFMEVRRKYLQGKIDYSNDSTIIGSPDTWDFSTELKLDERDLRDLKLTGTCQFLVPNIKYDRIFMNDKLDLEYTKETAICINYPKQYLLDKTPTAIHINPGKLTKITKRLFKVDRNNPSIEISTENTEFYGFAVGDIHGHLLLPEAETDDGGYILNNTKGIYLSYNQAQQYDYVLSITYAFSWAKATGVLKQVSSKDSSSSYYVPNFLAPQTIFINGYELEDTAYKEDGTSNTITINEDIRGMEMQALHTSKREFGFVRIVDNNGYAIIHTAKNFKQPLVFMNGEAMNSVIGDVKMSDLHPEDSVSGYNYFEVKGGKLNMTWGVIDLYDYSNDFNMFESAGVIEETGTTPVVPFTTDEFEKGASPVLFVDGMMVSQSDLIVDKTNKVISVPFLKVGQDYILLVDKYGYFIDSTELLPAIEVDRLTDSLVYHNGYLLCDKKHLIQSNAESGTSSVNHEIKLMVSDSTSTDAVVIGAQEYQVENSEIEGESSIGDWTTLDEDTFKDIMTFCNTYENTVRSIKFNDSSIDQQVDDIQIYAFSCANDYEHVVSIGNVPKQLFVDSNGDRVTTTQILVDTQNVCLTDAAGMNNDSISVYLNGVMQYEGDSYEFISTPSGETTQQGRWICFKKPVTGIVSYLIEPPENGNSHVCTRISLDHNNVVEGSINVYETIFRDENDRSKILEKEPLYPGRIVVYINGVRQPSDSYTILDNYTIMFLDEDTALLGNDKNYHKEVTTLEDGTVDVAYTEYINTRNGIKKIRHLNGSDKILIEVRNDYGWSEAHFKLKQSKDNYKIVLEDYKLNSSMLETTDEIKIYIDGLFFGLKNNEGYRKISNVAKPVLEIINPDIVGRLVSDPMLRMIESTADGMQKYKNAHDGQEYEPTVHDIILEWR